MAVFYNQATLTFGGNVVNSNTTEAELLSGLTLTKTAISSNYTAGGNVAYAITISNMSGVEYNALTVTDNLGAYTLPGGTEAVPLTYEDGSLLYYLNGVLQPAPTVSSVGNLEISGINIPAGGTATFVYGGGQANTTDTFTVTENVNLPVLSRTGYTYVWKVSAAKGNWNLGDSYTGSSIAAGMYGDVTFTLEWTPKTDATYSVRYFYEGTERPVAVGKTITNCTYGAEYSENAIALEGYTLVGANTQKVTAGYENNIITFY